MDNAISESKCSCDNSWPPLKPMANNKYNEINFEEFGGISKSLFRYTAIIPSTKNNKAGLVKFSISKLKFMGLIFKDYNNHNTLDLLFLLSLDKI